jgi:hypothetical protein
VPYASYNYRVEVISPVEPEVTTTTTIPTVTLADVKKWVNSFEGLIDDENSRLFPLFILLRDIAKDFIVYNLCDNKNQYIRIVSYYIAHNMELHIKALKDQENRMSMVAEQKDEAKDMEEFKITLVDNHYGNYKQTIWGQMFWTLYGHLSKFNIGYGVY